MERKKKKSIILVLLSAVLLVGLLTAATVTVIFAGYLGTIDADIDVSELFYGHGLTTKIYVKNSLGVAVELEDQRLFGEENRVFVPIDSIPSHVIDAFVAIEDHRFWEHSGFDAYRLAGAAVSFVSPSMKNFGGSTITQQLIKNLTGENEVTVKRKLTELLRAARLEKTTDKRRILELYLNTVYLSQGCYGVETASEKYFGKRVSELSVAEGASLAAIIRYPTRYDPIVNPENNVARRNVVLARMNELGYLSNELFSEASQTPLSLSLSTKKETSGAKNSWFTDCLIEQILSDLCTEKGMSRAAASKLLYSGGLTIYSTENVEMQSMLSEYYTNVSNIPSNTAGISAQSAAVILDKHGAVLAVVGGKGEKTYDRGLCLATGNLRSPGSVIKPVSVYAPALDRKLITWATVFDDVPVTFTKTTSGYTLWPKNNPRVYSGLVTVNRALQTSINTVSVKILQKLGVRASFDFLRDVVGISTLVGSSGGKTDLALAPLALGATTDGVSLLEMTCAYTMFADGGNISHPHFYTEVYDRSGKLLLSRNGETTPAISPETADIMTRMMQNVVAPGGTASCVTLARSSDVAGKTGTSNANTDRWFIGYTPDLICGVWYGFKDARDLGSFNDNPAALIFDGVMKKALDVIPSPQKRFDHSKNVVACLYCADSGALPSPVCALDPRGSRTELGYFLKGTEPRACCKAHVLADVCIDGGIALPGCECASEPRAMINVVRRFPCQVRIKDAQYVFIPLPEGQAPCPDESKAFFENPDDNGTFVGSSGVILPYNRACRHCFPQEEDFSGEEENDE